jgi:hypothetical protein
MGTETTRIKPPEGGGWQVHSPYGAQRYKDGPDGYVVRLADVVRWLVQARETSFASAVRAVCAPLALMPGRMPHQKTTLPNG